MRKTFALLFALLPLDVFSRDSGSKTTLITVGVVLAIFSCLVLYVIIYTKIKDYKDKKDGKINYHEDLNDKIMSTPLDDVIKFVDDYLVAYMTYRKGNEYMDLSKYQLAPIITEFFHKYMYLDYINKYTGFTVYNFDVFSLQLQELDEGMVCLIEDHEDLHTNLFTIPYSDVIHVCDDGYPTEEELSEEFFNKNIYTFILHNILSNIYHYEYVNNRQWPDVEWFYQKHFYKQSV